jgi:hypothetical protein
MNDILALFQLWEFETNAASGERRVRRRVNRFFLASFVQDEVEVQIARWCKVLEISYIQLRQHNDYGCRFRQRQGNLNGTTL